LVVLADIAEESDMIEEDEETVIKNLLRLRDIEIQSIMTPRVVVTSVGAEETVADVMRRLPIMVHGRMPIIAYAALALVVSFWPAGRNDRIHSIGFTMGIIRTIRILNIRQEEIVISLQYKVPRVFGRISERRRIPKVRIAEAMATPYWPGFSDST